MTGRNIFTTIKALPSLIAKPLIAKLNHGIPMNQPTVTIRIPPRKAKVCIATPCYRGDFTAEYVHALFQLINDNSDAQAHISYEFIYVDYADIVTSRNYLLSKFYYNKPDCTHLLFIDNDMGFDPTLIHQMINLRESVVGVVAPARSIDLQKLHKDASNNYKKAYNKALRFIGAPTATASHHKRNKNFSAVSQCGTGIMLISRKCITKMTKLMPEIIDEEKFKKTAYGNKFPKFLTAFNKIELDDKELSEDLSFCHRWVQGCGGVVYVGNNFNIKHVGKMTITGNYSDIN